ncbi:M23 family metallopeptidase [Pseudoxanthomonas sp.]|jgi:murein DD-endopeptidase MepM/ murein hydrolase activator NlpD|uniref:M23 family metallopeptidase n=1 Tax=Pseudoxanthomonas sp. TaxID=1871049 RepID=UPI002E13F7A7|nr:M23 family metallopeptidase [Pseudoxanthomonas sp.]
MKYVLALLLVLGAGVLVWRGVEIVPTPRAMPTAGADRSAPAASPAVTASDTAPAGSASTGIAVAAPAPVPSPSVPVPAATHASSLLIPVQGARAADLRDTFSDARSEGRSHDAIDIMAPRGTPVVAVADGHVEKLFTSERGGLTVYQFEPSGRYAYYYAHLDRYADGLAEQQTIRRGQVIGYLGFTGNASPDAPHLHFAIFQLGPERRWWEGTAINPYPLLTTP